MFIESGVIIFIGLMLMFIKLPRKTSLWLLGKPLPLDISVSVLAYILHWGTFTGVMAAAVAGLMCSGMTALGRKIVGYTIKGVYHPGIIELKEFANAKQGKTS